MFTREELIEAILIEMGERGKRALVGGFTGAGTGLLAGGLVGNVPGALAGAAGGAALGATAGWHSGAKEMKRQKMAKKVREELLTQAHAFLNEVVFKDKGTDPAEWQGKVAEILKAQGKPPLKHYFASGAMTHHKRLDARFEKGRQWGGPVVRPSKRTDPQDFSRSAKKAWKKFEKGEW